MEEKEHVREQRTFEVAGNGELEGQEQGGVCMEDQLRADGYVEVDQGKSARNRQSLGAGVGEEDTTVSAAVNSRSDEVAEAEAEGEEEDVYDEPGHDADSIDVGPGAGMCKVVAVGAAERLGILAGVHNSETGLEAVLAARHTALEGRIGAREEGRHGRSHLLHGEGASKTAAGVVVPMVPNDQGLRGSGEGNWNLDDCIPHRKEGREDVLHEQAQGQVASTCLQSGPCAVLPRVFHRRDASHPLVAVLAAPWKMLDSWALGNARKGGQA